MHPHLQQRIFKLTMHFNKNTFQIQIVVVESIERTTRSFNRSNYSYCCFSLSNETKNSFESCKTNLNACSITFFVDSLPQKNFPNYFSFKKIKNSLTICGVELRPAGCRTGTGFLASLSLHPLSSRVSSISQRDTASWWPSKKRRRNRTTTKSHPRLPECAVCVLLQSARDTWVQRKKHSRPQALNKHSTTQLHLRREGAEDHNLLESCRVYICGRVL